MTSLALLHTVSQRFIGVLLVAALEFGAPVPVLALRESQEDTAVELLDRALRGGLEEPARRQKTLLRHDDPQVKRAVAEFIASHPTQSNSEIANALNARYASQLQERPYRPFQANDIGQHRAHSAPRSRAKSRPPSVLNIHPVAPIIEAFIRAHPAVSHPDIANMVNEQFDVAEGFRPLTARDVYNYRDYARILLPAQRSRTPAPTLLTFSEDDIGARVRAFVEGHPRATHRTLAVVLNLRYRPIIQQHGASLALGPQAIWGYRKQHHLLQRELQSFQGALYALGSLTDADVAVWVAALRDAAQEPEALTALLKGVWQYTSQGGLPDAIAEGLGLLAGDHQEREIRQAALAILEGRLPEGWPASQDWEVWGSRARPVTRTLLSHGDPAIRAHVRAFIQQHPRASSTGVASALNLRYHGIVHALPFRPLDPHDIWRYRRRHGHRVIRQRAYEKAGADFEALFGVLQEAVRERDAKIIVVLIGALNAWDGTTEQRKRIGVAFRWLSHHVSADVRKAAQAAETNPPWLAVSEMTKDELAQIQPGVIVRYRTLMGSATGRVVSRRDDNHPRVIIKVQFPGKQYAFVLGSAPLEVKMASLPPAAGLEERHALADGTTPEEVTRVQHRPGAPVVLLTVPVGRPVLEALQTLDATVYMSTEAAEPIMQDRARFDEIVRTVNPTFLVTFVNDPVDARLLDARVTPRLRWIIHMGLGHNNIDQTAATRRGIGITSVGGPGENPLRRTTAEFNEALLLAGWFRLLARVEVASSSDGPDASRRLLPHLERLAADRPDLVAHVLWAQFLRQIKRLDEGARLVADGRFRGAGNGPARSVLSHQVSQDPDDPHAASVGMTGAPAVVEQLRRIAEAHGMTVVDDPDEIPRADYLIRAPGSSPAPREWPWTKRDAAGDTYPWRVDADRLVLHRMIAETDRARALQALLAEPLTGKTLAVMGPNGSIGSYLRQIMRGFGMRALGLGREGDAEAFWRTGDLLAFPVPLDGGTRGVLDPQRVASLSPGRKVISNIARGGLVADEASWCKALLARPDVVYVADVSLDEFAAHQPLLALGAQGVVTPHMASNARTVRNPVGVRDRMGWVAVENLRAVLDGRPPPNLLLVPLAVGLEELDAAPAVGLEEAARDSRDAVELDRRA